MKEPQIPANENQRQKALESYMIIDSLPEQSFDDLTLIASQVCDTPIALVSLIDKDRQWFKSKFGTSLNQTDRSISVCGHAINEPNKTFVVADLRADERFFDNPLVIGETNLGFYAGVPLVDSADMAIGTLCVMDDKSRNITDNQLRALEALARQVMFQIELKKKSIFQISEIESKEKELSDSQEKYFEQYHNAPDMMVSIDPYTRKVVDCNRTLWESLGYEEGEMIGLDLFELYHPDCSDEVHGVLKEFLLKGIVHQRRLILQTKTGGKINIEISIKPVKDANGVILYSNSILRNIDKLVLVENKLKEFNTDLKLELSKTKSFLEKVTLIAPSIIYVFDLRTMSNEYSNRELGKVLGYSSQEILEVGKDLMTSICHTDDLNKVFEHFEKIKVLNNNESASVEYRMKHKDGHYVTLLSEDTVFERNKEGEPIKHIGVATDISMIKENHDKLAVQKEMLERQNADLKQFAYVAMHDMKGPIVTVNGHFNYLKTKFVNPSDEIVQSIEFMEEEISRVMNTVEGLNAAIQIREVAIQEVTVDVNEVLNSTIDFYKNALQQKEGRFDISLSPIGKVVGTDVYVNSIFTNLISNAVKYAAPERKPVISITSNVEEGFLKVTVGDNGLGIDLNLQGEKVFKMFNRFHQDYEGTGMGLYMVKSMVEKLGGTVEIDSEVNIGTKVTVKLKLVDEKN